MIGEPLTIWLPVLGSLAWKSLLVFAVAAIALWGLRRASAALRHLVCLLTLTALLVLPALSLTLPGWRLPIPALMEPTPAQAPSVSQSAGTPIPADKSPTLPSEGRAKKGSEPAAKGAASALTIPSEGRDRPRTNVNGPGIGSGGSFPWLLLPAVWLGGLLLAALRPILGLWGIAGLSRASAPVTDPTALALADECAAALGLTILPALRQADAPVPMTWGGRHPVVLLPLDAQAWPEDRLRAVLLHELAHVRRRDWLSHRFADLLCALYWFHPLVWLTARRLRAESEIACDDLVLTSGLAAPDYARHLLDVARALRPLSPVPQAAIAMARTTHIEGRLKMILDSTRSRRALTRRVLLLVLTPGLAALILLAMLRPAAKAQSVPVPVAAVPAQPSVVETAPMPVAVPPIVAAQPASPKAAATLTAPVPVAPSPTVESVPPVPPNKVYGLPIRLVKPVDPVRVSAKDITINLLPSVKSEPLVLTTSSVEMVTSADPLKLATLAVFGSDLKINGTTLLAGVTDADKPGSPWWSADSAPLAAPVYDTEANRGENHAFGRDTKNVIFALRLPPSAQDVTTEYEVPRSRGYSSDGVWPTKLRENAQRTEAQMFAKTGGVRVLTAAFPSSLTKAGIRIGIASGAWKTVAAINAAHDPSGLLREENGTKFLLSPLAETKGGLLPETEVDSTTLTVATDTTEDVRVVAIDTQGREILPMDIGGNSIRTLDQITARFGLRLSQIKEVRVQTRKFQWIELKDIALQPTP